MARVRRLTSDDEDSYGCAEATFVALKHHFELPHPADPSAAMALNGGIAYSGGICGAITGAALALGGLVATHIDDHAVAKRTTRRLMQRVMAEFNAEFGALTCRRLTGFDLLTDHDGFMESGVWESGCMSQIAFVLDRIAPLDEPARWDEVVSELSDSEIPIEPETGGPVSG